jgi:hypothetical protein
MQGSLTCPDERDRVEAFTNHVNPAQLILLHVAALESSGAEELDFHLRYGVAADDIA